jgi:hypothetical protein
VLHVVSEVGAIPGFTQRRDGQARRGDDGLDQAPLCKAVVKVVAAALSAPPLGALRFRERDVVPVVGAIILPSI